jgi:hypothetical protein
MHPFISLVGTGVVFPRHGAAAKIPRSNHFLTSINNEVPTTRNATYAAHLAQLETLVLVLFERDRTVVPKESSWFGSYAPPPPEDEDAVARRRGRRRQSCRCASKRSTRKTGLGCVRLTSMGASCSRLAMRSTCIFPRSVGSRSWRSMLARRGAGHHPSVFVPRVVRSEVSAFSVCKYVPPFASFVI